MSCVPCAIEELGHMCADLSHVVGGSTSAFYVHGIISSAASRTRMHSPPLSLSLYQHQHPLGSFSPRNTSRRTVTAAFDVQFPFANEASALTRKHQILFASLSLDVAQMHCTLRRRVRVRRTPTTRPTKPTTNDVAVRLLSAASRFAPESSATIFPPRMLRNRHLSTV